MDLHEVWKALARRRPTVVACLVLSIGAAVAATAPSAPAHQASTRLFVATSTREDTTQLNQGQSLSQAPMPSYAAIVTHVR